MYVISRLVLLMKERYHLNYIPNILKDILNGDM